MSILNVTDTIKSVLNTKIGMINARIFVTREDGITVFDSSQDSSTASVSALVSGVWQASEALMGIANPGQEIMEFRFSFDTSSQGIYLCPFSLLGKKYYLGALFKDCLNPGQLKRKIYLLKDELVGKVGKENFEPSKNKIEKRKVNKREGYLFNDISDEEIDRLFSVGGI